MNSLLLASLDAEVVPLKSTPRRISTVTDELMNLMRQINEQPLNKEIKWEAPRETKGR